jgi:hypothetical protein
VLASQNPRGGPRRLPGTPGDLTSAVMERGRCHIGRLGGEMAA